MKIRSLIASLFLILTATATLGAQESVAETHEAPAKVDIITPHITDGNHMEVPWPLMPFYKEITLPTWKPVQIGPVSLDLSPSKHVVFLFIGAFLLTTIMILAARAQRRAALAGRPPKGAANAIEAMVLFVRNEVILPNVGHKGEGFVPYLLTVFFFILILNLLGLVPYGSTATGNISVTAALALLTFITIEISGMRAQGLGYLNTIFYWDKSMALPMRIIMFVIMSPVEIVGKFTKPFSLAIRLFANMTAGHVIVLAFIGMIFTFAAVESLPVRIIAMGLPAAMVVAIMFLELLVAFIQAYIFTLLSAVFIGQIREGNH